MVEKQEQMNKEYLEQSKQVRSVRLKLQHMGNYINCKCSAVQLKDRNQNGIKANYYCLQKTHLKIKDTEELRIKD